MTKSRWFAFFLAAFVVAWSSIASAQQPGSPPAGWHIVEPPAAPPPGAKMTTPQECVADAECTAKLRTCTESVDALKGDCIGAVARLVSPKPAKPIKHKCHGVQDSEPQEDGNGCRCGNPNYTVVREMHFDSLVCMPNMDAAKALYDRLHKLETSPGGGGADLGTLKKSIDELTKLVGGNTAQVAAFASKYVEVDAKVGAFERRLRAVEDAFAVICPVLPSNPTATLAERCTAAREVAKSVSGIGPVVPAKTSTYQVSVNASTPLIHRGPARWGWALIGDLDFRFRLTATSPFSFEVLGGAGRYFNKPTGPATIITEAAGVRWYFTDKHDQSLGLLFRSFQYASDHAAGYEGVLKQPGVGWSAGCEFGYGVEIWQHLRFDFRTGLGGGPVNWFAGPGDLGHAPVAAQFTSGASIGGQF